MARLSRITIPGLPHHVTQRGARRQALFVEPGDYALYRDLLAERCRANAVACWAYCLTPNHVQLILVPSSPEGLSRAVGEANRRYTAFFNARARATGPLFQGRFASVAMDQRHCLNAVRHLALSPIRAGLADTPRGWPHSSVAAHFADRDDALVSVAPILAFAPRFAELLAASSGESPAEVFTAPNASSRPRGGPDFLAEIERLIGRSLRARPRGRKPKLTLSEAAA
ncbi:MAG: transposase [Bradyrhizobium sp.]|nr:MAG: transposase [Bradyrhizobium sp.]